MTAPVVQYWVGVKLVLRALAAPTTTKDIWLTTRPNYQVEATDPLYWPIIIGIEGLGFAGGDWLPEVVGGTITIDNRPGTVGLNRKFSDLLERYAIVNQTVEVYITTTADENYSFVAGDIQWSGHVESWSARSEEGSASVDLVVSSDTIPDRPACFVVDQATFPNAPAQTIGKVLPIMAGADVAAPVYPTSENGNHFLISCHMPDVDLWDGAFEVGGTVFGYYQYYDSTWAPSTQAPSPQTGAISRQYALDSDAAWACRINSPGDVPLSYISISFHPNDTGGSADLTGMVVTCSIHEVDMDTITVKDEIASTSEKMEDYHTQNRAASDFNIFFTFRPIVTLSARDYAVVITCNNFLVQAPLLNFTDAVTTTNWYQTTNALDESTLDFIRSTAVDSFSMSFTSWWPSLYWDGVKNVDHLSYTKYLTGNASPIVGGAYTGLPSEEADCITTSVVGISCGLIDDSAGSISGSSGDELDRPDWFINAITREWGGTYWATSTRWDFSTYATEYAALYDTTKTRGRLLRGYVPDYVTLPDLVEAVCKDSATKIGIMNDGKLFPWPWGYAYSVTAHIPPEDIIPHEWTVDDPTSVVNRASISYDRTLTDMTMVTNAGLRGRYNVAKRLDWSPTSPSLAALLAADSDTLYGVRPLDEIETNFIWDAVSAATLLEYYMATSAHPETMVEFSVPWDTYKTLRMYQVITFAHPDFPCFYGTTPEDNQPQAPATGTRANLTEGRPLQRAKQYRGLIEGRYLQLPVDGAPSIRLRVRVLLNYPKDPT